MKHTPGPWTVEQTETDNRILQGEDSDIIAYADRAFGDANAHLIAAAPALLETLKWIMPKVHQAHHEGSIDDCQQSTCCEYRKVISEAERWAS